LIDNKYINVLVGTYLSNCTLFSNIWLVERSYRLDLYSKTMAYSLRSRRNLTLHLDDTQTDTPVTNPTDSQITANLPQAVPIQLELQQDITLPTTLTNPTFPTPEPLQTASSKPEVEFASADSNITGPVRVDPALQTRATLSAEFGPQNNPTNLQEVVHAQASTSLPGGDDIIPPSPSADELGPSPTVTGREPISIPSSASNSKTRLCLTVTQICNRRTSSKTSLRTRSSRRSQQTAVTEAILNFGSQLTNNLLTMAEQHRQDAMWRKELLHQEALAIRQEAHAKEKIAAKREKEIAEQNATRMADHTAPVVKLTLTLILPGPQE